MKYQRILSRALVSFVLTLTMVEFSTAQVERIWLTHPSSKPDKLSINWESVTPGNAVVRYGASEQYDSMITIEENTRLHQVEISLNPEVGVYHYQVSTNSQQSDNHTFKNYPKDELRVAVVADWQGKPNLDILLQEDIHLFFSEARHYL